MVNSSLGLAEAELLRRVDERVGSTFEGPRERARWIRDLLANKVLAQGSGERFSVPDRMAEQLTERAHKAVKQLADAGYDVVGSLDDLVPATATTPTRLPEDLSSEELLDAAVNAIAGLLAEAKAQSDRHAERSRRLKDRLAAAVVQGRVPTSGRPWQRLFSGARQKESGTDQTVGPT
jgi:hypothetical protein